MDYQAFVNGGKTMLVAPAGYGKTHTIAECLKYTNGKQLILTHTHAGVASIKDKIDKSDVEPKAYSIETISSFAQRYTHAFYTEADMPNQDEKDYHAFVVKKAIEIFKCPVVKRVVAASYQGLFVDEYQDCSKNQHAMISAISDVLPTHILGDPMQGIFDFNGDAVEFDEDLEGFDVFPELTIPHRWYRTGNNSGLGDFLKDCREKLKSQEQISLTTNAKHGLYIVMIKSDHLQDASSRYRRCLDKLIQNPQNKPEYDSLLIMVPEYEEQKKNGVRVPRGDIKHRAQIRTQIDYSKSLRLLEAIDDKRFYTIAKKADGLIDGIVRARNHSLRIRKDALDRIFNKTDLDEWFSDKGLKKKHDANKIKLSVKIQNKIDNFVSAPSAVGLYEIILEAQKGLKLKYKREEIFFSFLRALNEAEQRKISVYEAMKKNRNTIRRFGRKVHGKCIGTTLLTKGLEFDTVAILDAHRYKCPKQLYVALTRCCKKLIIFTEQASLL